MSRPSLGPVPALTLLVLASACTELQGLEEGLDPAEPRWTCEEDSFASEDGVPLPLGTTAGLTLCNPGDVDVFSVSVAPGGRLDVITVAPDFTGEGVLRVVVESRGVEVLRTRVDERAVDLHLADFGLDDGPQELYLEVSLETDAATPGAGYLVVVEGTPGEAVDCDEDALEAGGLNNASETAPDVDAGLYEELHVCVEPGGEVDVYSFSAPEGMVPVVEVRTDHPEPTRTGITGPGRGTRAEATTTPSRLYRLSESDLNQVFVATDGWGPERLSYDLEVWYEPEVVGPLDVTVRGERTAGGSVDHRAFANLFTLGDLDGDGRDEVGMADPQTRQVRIYTGADLADASEDLAWWYLISGDTSFGEHVTVGDIDQDGLQDLLIGAPEVGSGGRISIYLGKDLAGGGFGLDASAASVHLDASDGLAGGGHILGPQVWVLDSLDGSGAPTVAVEGHSAQGPLLHLVSAADLVSAAASRGAGDPVPSVRVGGKARILRSGSDLNGSLAPGAVAVDDPSGGDPLLLLTLVGADDPSVSTGKRRKGTRLVLLEDIVSSGSPGYTTLDESRIALKGVADAWTNARWLPPDQTADLDGDGEVDLFCLVQDCEAEGIPLQAILDSPKLDVRGPRGIEYVLRTSGFAYRPAHGDMLQVIEGDFGLPTLRRIRGWRRLDDRVLSPDYARLEQRIELGVGRDLGLLDEEQGLALADIDGDGVDEAVVGIVGEDGSVLGTVELDALSR